MPAKQRFRAKLRASLVVVVVLSLALRLSSATGGQFLIDFGDQQGEAAGWDAFRGFQEDDVVRLTDWSGSGDDDVTLTAVDAEFASNDIQPPGVASEYDGIAVPVEANGDYVYRDPDTAGTSAQLRIDNLDSGYYDVTVFEGRTNDRNGQFAEFWVGDGSEKLTSDRAVTTNFAAGHSTVEVFIGVGGTLWFKHLEDGAGGVSGMMINPRSPRGRLPLEAGDADQDFDFDQFDLVQVQVAAKYLTGQPATWGEGDWNGAPGGTIGAPPPGDGLFNQLDIVAALDEALYLRGPYDLIANPRHAGELPVHAMATNDGTAATSAFVAVPEPAYANLIFGLLFLRRFIRSARPTPREDPT